MGYETCKLKSMELEHNPQDSAAGEIWGKLLGGGGLYEWLAFLSPSLVPLFIVLGILVILFQFTEIKVVTSRGRECWKLHFCKGDATLFQYGFQAAS